MQRHGLQRTTSGLGSWALLLLVIGCLGLPAMAFGKGKPSVPSIFKNMQPMQVQLVRSTLLGCEPNCTEWISAEGDIVDTTPGEFRKVLGKIGSRNLPLFINSGGGSIEAAIAIGALLRDRKIDVSVTRTEFEPCTGTAKACKGDGKTPKRGRPNSFNAYCASACTLVLASGTRRLASSASHVGVHQIIVFQTQIRIRRTYRVTTFQRPDGGTRTSRRLIHEQRMPGRTYEVNVDDRTYKPIVSFLSRMGIDQSLIPLMEATPNTSIHWMSHDELATTHLVTEELGGDRLLPLATAAQASSASIGALPASSGSPDRPAQPLAEAPIQFRGANLKLRIGYWIDKDIGRAGFAIDLREAADAVPTKGLYAELTFDQAQGADAYNINSEWSAAPLETSVPITMLCRLRQSTQLQLRLHATDSPGSDSKVITLPVASTPGLLGMLVAACSGTTSAAAN